MTTRLARVRVFLDANVLFSAAKTRGAVHALLVRMVGAGHVLCADAYVVAEARRNVEAKGSDALKALDILLEDVELAAFRSQHLSDANAALLPEKDRPVLAAAITLRCNALLTGDRTHFGSLYGRTFYDVTIHSPRSLAEVLNASR